MSCSKEEIERKRLAALQKRQNKVIDNTAPQLSSLANLYGELSKYPSAGPSLAGPVKPFGKPSQKTFHPYAKPNNGVKGANNVPIGKVVSGTVYLISEDRFEVNPSEFCTPLINMFKTLQSKSYDSKSKLWNFSIDDYDTLMSKVSSLNPHVVLGPIPSYVLQILKEDVKDPNNIDLSPVEATLRHKLMPFQEEGVRFAIARGGRCMIADDMGLGKTFQALAVASFYRNNWPLLIVTTSSMRETWQTKIHELLPSVPLMNIVTLTTSKDAQLVADRQTEIVIVSYKITTMHTELLKNKNFGFVIIDESHYLKSHKAQCTTALSSITRRCRRLVLLSGTPALSRPAELYTQLTLISPRLVSFTEYGKRYCDGKQTTFGWDMNGQSNLAELQIILQKKFLIRRTKDQVLTNLEGKIRETVLLDQTLLQFNRETDSGLSQAADMYKQTSASKRHAALITYFSETARVKIPAICKYIREIVREQTDKFLVFAHHRCVIEAVCSELDEAGVNYICIVGATPPHTRAELVDKFQHSASCRSGVLSVTATNSGLTLTSASLVLFVELHWNPGILTQAEARAHRIGQQKCVRVRYLLAHGTADDYMWPMLQDKLNVLNDVGLSKDTFADTTTKHQASNNHITQYLTPTRIKNKSEYIPGTNIRKDSQMNNSVGKSNSDIRTNRNNSNSDNVNNDNSGNNVANSSIKLENNNLNSDFLDVSEFSDVFEKSFFDSDEDDELLARLDM